MMGQRRLNGRSVQIVTGSFVLNVRFGGIKGSSVVSLRSWMQMRDGKMTLC